MFHFSDRVRHILSGIVSHQAIGNAYLFSGSPGAFVRHAADYFSLSANCQQFDTDPCLKCTHCKAFQNKQFVDYYSLQPDSPSIKIEAIRFIQDYVKYGPSVGRHFFVVIHQAHLLTPKAANAFLKTLEDPPDHVVFILLTHHASTLLPTIQSRCQHLQIPPLSHPHLMRYLETFPDDQQTHIRNIIQSTPPLLPYALEDPDTQFEHYQSLPEFLNLSLIDRLSLAEKWAMHKPNAQLFLNLWIQDLWQSVQSSTVITQLKLIIDHFSKMRYNVDVKLHLESLFLKL